MKHLPNALSIARIAITPIFVYLFLGGTIGAQLVALVLFVAGAITDWLDGELARRFDARSRLGQFLDPLADKVLVLAAFFAIFFLPADADGRLVYESWWWIPVGAIALRDVAVTWLRSWAERHGRTVRTRYAAKVKTTVQLTFLITLQVFLVAALLSNVGGWLGDAGTIAAALLYSPAPDVLLVVTAVLTVWTGALYFRRPPLDAAATTPVVPGGHTPYD
jgi:CDP-diacylglycerol--glycerol-3-phosphate 3-phosphatidyltransferase